MDAKTCARLKMTTCDLSRAEHLCRRLGLRDGDNVELNEVVKYSERAGDMVSVGVAAYSPDGRYLGQVSRRPLTDLAERSVVEQDMASQGVRFGWGDGVELKTR